jgi:hypothetical protein
MKRTASTLSVMLVVGVVSLPAAAEDDASVHRMVTADGELDTEKCASCHEDDFSLSRSKSETCTLCHAHTVHSGSAEHLRATAAKVAHRTPAETGDGPDLPLTEEGTIYCGTCHIFHDPAVAGEELLVSGRKPKPEGRSEEIRTAVVARLNAAAKRHGAGSAEVSFSAEGTRSLRLPVDDGSLCRHCHAYAE